MRILAINTNFTKILVKKKEPTYFGHPAAEWLSIGLRWDRVPSLIQWVGL